MKQGLISALVAAVVSIGAWQVMNLAHSDGATEAAAPVAAPPVLRYTDELVEDGWVARAPGADEKPLEHASNSICYLTKIELKGIQAPEDANSCAIGIDEFTGFWQLTAAVGEGGRSEIRCNARCLVWE
ncbi:MAG TPA: hypothetical protein VKA43_14105 [Gammaproteobacteria bacterium]|nr:hypothetical protein [Gammaproteobacteria bacterium]